MIKYYRTDKFNVEDIVYKIKNGEGLDKDLHREITNAIFDRPEYFAIVNLNHVDRFGDFQRIAMIKTFGFDKRKHESLGIALDREGMSLLEGKLESATQYDLQEYPYSPEGAILSGKNFAPYHWRDGRILGVNDGVIISSNMFMESIAGGTAPMVLFKSYIDRAEKR